VVAVKASWRAAALALLVVMFTAGPAAADPAKPGEYTSTITSVEPALEHARVEILGGDSFLQVSVDRDHEVDVYAPGTPDVDHGQPFHRVRADGVVEENRQSPYTYAIQTRYGTQPPDGLDPSGPPDWQQVGTGGVFAWHDHRVHWMSPTKKAGIHPGDIVQTWSVAMAVDGTAVTVAGVVRLAHPISPIPWFAAAVVLAAAAVLLGRGASTFVAAITVLFSALAALVVGLADYRAVPPRAGGTALVWVLPAIALVAAVVALVRHRTALGVIASLLAAACLGGWAIQRIAVLLEPVLPTDLPFAVDRAGTAGALGAAAAAAVLAVRSGGLVPRFAELVDDEEDDD
jgi:hypothetical protein